MSAHVQRCTPHASTLMASRPPQRCGPYQVGHPPTHNIAAHCIAAVCHSPFGLPAALPDPGWTHCKASTRELRPSAPSGLGCCFTHTDTPVVMAVVLPVPFSQTGATFRSASSCITALLLHSSLLQASWRCSASAAAEGLSPAPAAAAASSKQSPAPSSLCLSR